LQEVIPQTLIKLKEIQEKYPYQYPKKLEYDYGNIIFSKKQIVSCFSYPFKNSRMGRTIELIQISINNNKILIACSHFESEFNQYIKNKEKICQIIASEKIMSDMYDTFDNVIFCLDTNLIKSEESLFFKSNNWNDGWTLTNKDPGYTYDSNTNNNLIQKNYKVKYRSRLDRIIYKCKNYMISKCTLLDKHDKIDPSDHHGIMAIFNIK
jgi:hypothetical protein